MRGFARVCCVLIGVASAGALTVPGWAAEPSPPAGYGALARPVLPPSLLDPKLLDTNKFGTDFSRSPRSAPSAPSSFSFDFKTDYAVDIEKLLPTDQYPQRSLMPPNKLPNGTTPKRTIPLMGLSISAPLN